MATIEECEKVIEIFERLSSKRVTIVSRLFDPDKNQYITS